MNDEKLDEFHFDESDLISIEDKLSQTMYYVSILEKKCNDINEELTQEKDLKRKVTIYKTEFEYIQKILNIKTLEINNLKRDLEDYKKMSEAKQREINNLKISLKRMNDKNNYLRQQIIQLKEELDNNFLNNVKNYFKR